MANRILTYEQGKNIGIAGTATGQVLTWNDSTQAFELVTGGTVTSITAGTGLTGGVITGVGTIAADFGTIAGTIAQGNDSRFPEAPSSAGRLLYDNGSAWVALAAGAAGKVLQSNGAAAPSWETAGTGTVTQVSTGTGLTGGPITTSGTISLAALDPAPTGSYGSDSSVATVTVDQYGRVTAASSTSIAIAASQITSGTLGVARGGTGQASLTANAILLGNGTNGINSVSLTANGQVLIGSGTGAPTAATLTQGTGVTITNGANSITIAIGQAIGTAASPTFVGLTLSGLTANRFIHTDASGNLVSLSDGSSKVVGYNSGGSPVAFTIGSGLDLTGNTLSATGSGGTVTSIALDLGATGLKLAGNVTTQTITSSGTFALSGTLAVANGGTGLTGGTSGGVPYYSSSSALASSAALAANEIVLGGGAGAAPATLGAKGTTAQVLHGNASGAPSWGAVSLTADVSGTLPIANGGTGAASLAQYAVLLGNATSAIATAAPSTSGQVLTSNGASANPSFQSLPYDISGEVAGTPTASAVVFHFRAARAFTLKGTGHVAYCDMAPSGTTTFTIAKNGSPIGTIEYSVAGGLSGTVTITSGVDTAIAIGDRLTVTADSNLYTLGNPFWTFLGSCP